MSTRRILVNGKTVFMQIKESLRGTFVGAKFSRFEISAQCRWGAALRKLEFNNVYVSAHEDRNVFSLSRDLRGQRGS